MTPVLPQRNKLNFEELIETGNGFAQISFLYRGSAAAGMMAWLDSMEMKSWWRADSAIIEPYSGGLFYITWSEKDESRQHAIYGVMDVVNVEQNRIEVSKILYMSPLGKLGPVHLELSFEAEAAGYTRLWLRHTHGHKGQQQKLYDAAVYAAWPKTFAPLQKHLESEAASG